jgi:hypothetical protein
VKADRALAVAAALLAVGSAALLQIRRDLGDEVAVLAAASDSAQAAASDARLQQEVDRIRFQLEQARVGAGRGTEPHLALAITDGLLTLERGDVQLRAVRADVAVPRGVRTVARVTGDEIVLSDSARIYASAAAGDSSPPRPRSVRVRPADFAAVAPNVRAGHLIYVF